MRGVRLFGFIILFCMLICGTTVVAELTRTGLILEHHFDGDAKDTSGSGNDGVIHGATFVIGVKGQALSFNGVDNFVDNQFIDKTTTNTFTMEFWVYPLASQKIDTQSNSGISGGTTSKPQILIWPTYGQYWGTNDAGAGIAVGTNGVNVYEHAPYYLPAVLTWEGNINGWTHIAVVYNNRQPSLYVNGNLVKVGLVGQKTYVHPSIEPLVGPYTQDSGFGGGVYGHFQGYLDEVHYYNRALSASEIKGNYEAFQSNPPKLSLDKSASPSTVNEGDTTTVTIRVENSGGDAKNIKIVDTVPQGFSLLSGTTTQELGSLKQGEYRTFQYTMKTIGTGRFVTDPATVTYQDSNGNSYSGSSNPITLIVQAGSSSNPQTMQSPTQKTPGFELMLSSIGILFAMYTFRRK